MPNRDQDDSQYDRSEGRFENRDESGYRDQSNRGSREWDRQGDDSRQTSGQGRGGSDYQNSREREQERYYEGRSGYASGNYGNTNYRGSNYGGGHGERDGQRLGQQDWNRSVGSYRPTTQSYGRGQDYGRGQQDYGRAREFDDRAQFGSYTPEWRSYAQDWGDQGRSQSYASQQSGYGSDARAANPFLAQERTRQEWNRNVGSSGYARPYYGERSYGGEQRGREDEGWGEQIRHAGEQVVNRVKRVFRGPKGYKRSDERIREDVNDRLAQQFDFDPSDVEVQVQGGEVTLSGTVRSRHEKFIAEEIADEVSGVNEVHNQIRVKRDELAQSSSATSATTTASTTQAEAQKNRNSPRA